MLRITSYILGILLLFLTTLATAQDMKPKWSLKKCIDYAYENNLQLKRSKNRIIINKNNLQQSKNDRLPTINASTSWNNSYGRSVDYVTNGYTNEHSSNISYGVGVSVTVFNGFRKKNQIEKNEFDLKVSLFDIETTKENLALNITALYLNILYAQEQLQIAKDNLKIAQKQENRVKELVNSGILAKGNLLEQQAQISKNESNIVDSENRLTLAYLDLYQLLDIPQEQAFLIISPNITKIDNPILLDYSKKYTDMIAKRPTMKAFEYRIKSAEKDIAITKSNYYPTIGLSANIGSGYSNLRYDYEQNNLGQLVKGGRMSFADQYDLNLSKSWGVSMNIPIFSKFQNRTAVKNAYLQIEDLQTQKEIEKNKLYKEIQQAHTKVLTAIKKYEAEQKSLASLEETFRYVEQKYQLGTISNFDYNEALNNLMVARSNMLQAKYECIFRSKILAFYNGEVFDF